MSISPIGHPAIIALQLNFLPGPVKNAGIARSHCSLISAITDVKKVGNFATLLTERNKFEFDLPQVEHAV